MHFTMLMVNKIKNKGKRVIDMQKTAGSNLSSASRGTRLRKRFASWQLYVMVIPALLYILLFHYKPMYGIIIAFKDFSMRRGILGSEWVGMANFTRLFSSYWFPVIIKNTLTLSLLSLVVGFPMPIILALMLNEVNSGRFRKTFQTVSYAPRFISTVVMCGMLVIFTNPTHGIFNILLNKLGFESINFLGIAADFKWVYVLSGVWQEVGWGSIIYFAALSSLDKSLLEAADIDGANRLQKIWYINLPVLVPTIMVLLILNFGSLLSVGYEKVYLLQNDTNLSASEVISTYVYKVGLQQADFSFSAATDVFNSVVNTCILLLANGMSKWLTKTSLF